MSRRRPLFESLENRVLLARDFLEDEPLNNTSPGQQVQHFLPSAPGVVDSRSVGASIQNADNDYYRFVASVNGDIVLTLTNNGGDPSGDLDSNVSLVFEQVNSTGTLIGAPVAVSTLNATGTITIPGVTGGAEYYARVYGATAAADANYTIEIANRDREDDGATNNNRIGLATPLGSVGAFPVGALNDYTITNGDRDFYQFTVPAGPPQTLNVSVIMPTGTGAASGVNGPTNLGLRIRNAAGTILSSSNASSTSAVDTAVLNNAAPGNYYVEVYSGSLGQVNRYDLSFVTPFGALSGFKWNDLNGDGMRQDHEPGMPGVVINLDLGNNGGAPDLTDVTDANGFYDFANVPYGTHRLTEVVPSGGYVQTWPDASENFAYIVVLDPLNHTLDHLDFGNYQGASVAGVKFNDLDADGQAREGGENGLGGWRIYVDYNNNSTWDNPVEPSALTDGTGAYMINGVLAGTYNVREVGQVGWTNSYPAGGAYVYTFTSGAAFTGADFGNWRSGTITGVKFEDLDADGANQEVGEPGLSGWRIYVDYDDDNTRDPGEPFADTVAGGGYTLAGVSPGTWTVREETQAGWTNSYPSGGEHSVTVTSDNTTSGWNFGNWRTATINGTKFNDLDVDGQPREGGEPGLLNWRIYVDYNGNSTWDNATEPSALTNAAGAYSITGVTPGTWTIREVGQAGWTNSFPAAGSYSQLFTSGSTTNNLDFGNWTTASVSGTKYEDDDADGVLAEPGETGLQGWTIYVDYNNNSMLDASEPSAVTNANGDYTITGVSPGNYNLREVLTSGWTQSSPAGGAPHAIAVQSAAALTGYNFGNWFPATISGTKFEDLDADGATQEVGEPGLPGWTIYVDYNNDGDRDANEPFAVTNGSGAYTISGVTPGSWRLREEQQVGWNNSFPGTSDGFGRYHPVAVFSQDALASRDFGNWKPATLSGVKFHDLDGDGAAREAGEPGLANWTIFVDYNGNGTLDLNEPSDQSDANGDYLITNITPGTYNVREVVTAGWTNSFPASGVYSITFLSCDSVTNRDFGNWTTSSISGVKYEDMDADGIVGELGEPGVSGWTIYVDYDNDNVLDAGEPNAATGAGGTYTINGVNPGNWSVREVSQAGWNQSFPSGGAAHSVPVSSNSTITGINFGNWRPASVSGTKYRDLDGDGTYPTEVGDTPLAGWTFYVDYNSNGIQDVGEPASAPSAANGTYSIANVQPGTWRVREQAQVGYTNTYPATSDAFGRYHSVTVSSNGTASSVDYLNYEIISITGVKFDDADDDGLAREVGEAGLPGWVIEVYHDVDNDGVFEPNQYIGNVLVATGDDGNAIHAASTNASGQYDVGGYAGYQVGQRYFIREAPRQGWTQNFPVPNVRSFIFNATSISGQDFGNHSCTTTIDVTNGVSSIPVQRAGILTLLVTGGGTFTASQVGNGSFFAYNPGSPNGLFFGSSLASRTDEFGAGSRVDILVTPTDVANGVQYNVGLSGVTANSHLIVLNAVNIDSSTVALQIYGSECGDFIAVRDDPADVNQTDAKRLMIGAEVGHLNLGQPIHFEGVQYNSAIINPLFGGNPAISRVEIYAFGGDDIVRVGDDITLQQSLIDLGTGADMARVGRNKATVFGGDGEDFLAGNVADDSLYGGDNIDRIYGDNGSDRIFGDSGNDLIGGGDGGDPLLRGGDGDDTISGGRGNDRILGDNGNDTAYRDAFDTLGVSAETVINGFLVSEVPQVDGVLRQLIDGVWDDFFVTDADDDLVVDTVDELIESLLP